jgi:hypothetical protein
LYGTSGIGSQFTIEPVQYVGGVWTNVQMVAADFNGDRVTDILAYRADNGAFHKWYSDGVDDFWFTYEPTHYVGNAPGAWTNVQMVPANFDVNGRSDVLVYRADTGAYANWYSDGGTDAGFVYEATQYTSLVWTDVRMVASRAILCGLTHSRIRPIGSSREGYRSPIALSNNARDRPIPHGK